MVQQRVNTNVAAKTEKMQPAVVLFDIFYQFKKDLVLKKRPVLYSYTQPDGFLRNNSTGPEVLMADFAVTHRTFRQTHSPAARVYHAVRILHHQHIVYGCISYLNRVVLIFRRIPIIAPPVSDYQNRRTHVRFNLIFSHLPKTFQPKQHRRGIASSA